MRDDTEVADAITDAVRSRVDPTAGPDVGHGLLNALALRGWRVARANATLVASDWLASVFIELNTGVPHCPTPGQKAAAYDRLVHRLNAHERGRT